MSAAVARLSALSLFVNIRALPANLRGALWVIAAGAMFTLVSVFIRLSSAELDTLQVAFFRCVFGLLFIAPVLARLRLNPFATPRLGQHVTRALIGTVSMLCGFYAVGHLPIADSTSISFSAPLFITLIAAVFMGEKVRWRRWTATIVGFLGVVIMLRPGGEVLQPAALVAVASALLMSIAAMMVKRLSAHEPAMSVLATFAIFSTVMLAVPAILVWRWPSPTVWLYVAAIGLGATVGQYFWVRGYAIAQASAVAPFDYLRMPLSVLMGFLVFAELPTIWTLVGTLIIAGSGLYIAYREAQLGRKITADIKPHKAPA
ncbi:MAG: DMT family transporter [Alphaproteobacteria bacterium]|nr:DMT family transporter [Alphaproteobacteria bacterium]